MNTQEFENKCKDIIEQIVAIDPKQDRQGAIIVTEKMLERAKKSKAKYFEKSQHFLTAAALNSFLGAAGMFYRCFALSASNFHALQIY